MAKRQIKKYGDSLGIKIEPEIIKLRNLKAGDWVDVCFVGEFDDKLEELGKVVEKSCELMKDREYMKTNLKEEIVKEFRQEVEDNIVEKMAVEYKKQMEKLKKKGADIQKPKEVS